MQVTRQVFEAGQGRLKVVGRAGVGIDNVDLQAATEVSSYSSANIQICSMLQCHPWTFSASMTATACQAVHNCSLQ